MIKKKALSKLGYKVQFNAFLLFGFLCEKDLINYGFTKI